VLAGGAQWRQPAQPATLFEVRTHSAITSLLDSQFNFLEAGAAIEEGLGGLVGKTKGGPMSIVGRRLPNLSNFKRRLLSLCAGLAVLTFGVCSARAQSPAPDRTFGGCNSAGTICGGPSASASFVILDLTNGTSRGGFVPGAGYGVTFLANQWYNLGVSLYASYVTGNGSPDEFTPILVASFAEYLRIGIGLDRTSAEAGVSGKTDVIMTFGLGLDFGATPGSQGNGIVKALSK
jgi:hypothetical protein